MKKKLAIAFLWLALSAAGCSFMPWSSGEVKPEPTADVLFQEGTEYFNNKKYVLAIDRFNRVKTDFPFSPILAEAELKLAESYYLNKQYPEAITAFKEFQAMHPTNENIPFVVYHLGMAHLAQFTAIDRDQKMTDIARGYFEMLVKNHSQSPYAAKADEKLAECKKYLAEHEFNIASFYIREKNYPAARDRLEGIVHLYPDTATAAKSIYHLGRTYQEEKNNIKASLAYEALLQHYPGSPFTAEAKTNLALLEKDKEKQDPLKILLMRDGRPFYTPPPQIQQATANEDGTGTNGKMPDLFAKKEIVYEEPGSEKGVFRRVVDTLNPFSSSDEKESDPEANGEVEMTETAKEDSDGSSGSFWSSLNPFSSKEKNKVVARKDAGLMKKVDESLKEKGVEAKDRQLTEPPASNLPQIAVAEEESKPPALSPEVVLEKVDTALQDKGKDADSLPPLPEIAPALQASSSADKKQPGEPSIPSRPSTEVLTGIDKALQQKGIEVPEIKPPERTTKSGDAGAGRSALSRPEKVELDTSVEFKKGPLFLESGDYQVQEKAEENDKKEPGENLAEPTTLPESVVTGPPQVEKKKPAEEKPADKRELAAEEEKSAFDQMREDLENASKVLNPFSW